MAEQHPALAGIYQLRQTIGQGGFGKVKLAYHVLTSEPVAIKIMDKKALAHDLPRVKVELSALRELVHENICRLIQVIETTEKYYVVLELCSGGELFDYIVSKDRLDEDEARLCFRQIIAAVGYAHSRGYAHRDLKPENFLLDDNGNVKLIDFGLCAKPRSGLLNEALATACGSPAYAAPELLRGQPYSGVECDLWSLGVLLYALVCGYLPFDDVNLSRLYAKILAGVYETPRFVSESCANLIASLMKVDAKRRIGMHALARHSWLTNGGLLNAVQFDRSALQSEVGCFDDSLVSLLSSRTAQRESSIREALSAWRYDSLTATYLLMKQAKARGDQPVLRADLNPTHVRNLLLANVDTSQNQSINGRFEQLDSPWVYKSCLRTVHNRVSNSQSQSRSPSAPGNASSFESPAPTRYRANADMNTTTNSRSVRYETISEERSGSERSDRVARQRTGVSPAALIEDRAVRRLLFEGEVNDNGLAQEQPTQPQFQMTAELDSSMSKSKEARFAGTAVNTYLVTQALSPSRSIDGQLDAVELADAVVRRTVHGEQASKTSQLASPKRLQFGTPNGPRSQRSTPIGQRNGEAGYRSKSEADKTSDYVSDRSTTGSIDAQLDALQNLRLVDSINQVALGGGVTSDSDADSIFDRVHRVAFAADSGVDTRRVYAPTTPVQKNATGKLSCTSPTLSPSICVTPNTPPTVIRRRIPKSALLNSIEKRFDRVRAFFTPRKAAAATGEFASAKVRRSRTQKYEHSARKGELIDADLNKHSQSFAPASCVCLPRRVRLNAQNISPLPIVKCFVESAEGMRRLAEPLEILDKLVSTLENRKIHVKRKHGIATHADANRNSARSSSLTDLNQNSTQAVLADPDMSTTTSAANGSEWKTGKKDRFAVFTLYCTITDDWNAVQLAFELELCTLVDADQLRACRAPLSEASAPVHASPIYAIRRKRLKGDVWSYKRLCDFLLNEF